MRSSGVAAVVVMNNSNAIHSSEKPNCSQGDGCEITTREGAYVAPLALILLLGIIGLIEKALKS